MPEVGDQLLAAARAYQDEIVTFLRDMIAIPAESLQEGQRCERVRKEYERLGFDEVVIQASVSISPRAIRSIHSRKSPGRAFREPRIVISGR